MLRFHLPARAISILYHHHTTERSGWDHRAWELEAITENHPVQSLHFTVGVGMLKWLVQANATISSPGKTHSSLSSNHYSWGRQYILGPEIKTAIHSSSNYLGSWNNSGFIFFGRFSTTLFCRRLFCLNYLAYKLCFNLLWCRNFKWAVGPFWESMGRAVKNSNSRSHVLGH